MFGYIKPHVPLLTVAEYEAYKGIYCGLCREMGNSTGQLSRMALSYDFVFLALLRMTVEKTPTKFDRGTCIAHPFKKKAFAESNDVLTFCAKSCAILAAEKCKDDINDEKGSKKLMAKAVYPIEKHAVSKLESVFSSLVENVSETLSKLSETEKNKTASIDVPAGIFGEILGEICSFGYEGAPQRICREIGRSIGKIIYVLDAADDISDDIKGEKYNPIALVYKDALTEASSAEEGGKKQKKSKKDEKYILRSDICKSLESAVGIELSKARAAFSLLDTEGCAVYSNILSNVFDYGIPYEAKRIFSGERKRDDPLKHNS